MRSSAVPVSLRSKGTLEIPDGFSITTRCASSRTMRNPAGIVWGRGALGRRSTRWSALTRVAGSSARSPSRLTFPLVQSARTSLQLWPGSRLRRAAASVVPSSAGSSVNVWLMARSATDEIEHLGQRSVEPAGVGAAPLRHVRASAPLAADRLGHLADDLAGVVLADEVGRHHRHQRDLVPLDACQHDDARAELVAQLIGHLTQRLRIGDVGAGGEHAHARHVARLGEEVASTARGQLAAQLLELLLQRALVGLQLADAGDHLELAGAQQAPALAQLDLQSADEGEPAGAGHGLDAPHALGDAALLRDQE